jgi:uncharacterized protein (DUF2141 family)
MNLSPAILGLALAGAALAYQAAPATGSIEGQVLNAATGAPLRKSTVRLMATGQPQAGTVGPRMPGERAQEVDEQARFSFTGLKPGTYLLTAERQRFLRQEYGGRKYNTSGVAIAVAAGQHVKDIVFKLSPQSVIAGKVVDEDGEGVANVQVRALRYQYRSGRKEWTQAGNGQTSDIGEYRIPFLDPGKYLVATLPRREEDMGQSPSSEPLPEKPEMRYAATYYPSTLEQANAVPVDVPAGGELHGIDIRLSKGQVFRVRGTVAGVSAGRNVVTVMLVPKDEPPVQPMVGFARAPDYRFEIRGVPPGSYIARAMVPSRGQQQQAVGTVEVADNHVEGVVLSVVPGGDITGLVKMEDGSALPSARRMSVVLLSSNSFRGQPPARVGEDARFTLSDVTPAQYRVSVIGVPDNCYVKSVRYGGQEVPDDGLDMSAGGTLEVTLSATAGAVTATVVDSDGHPDAGATVVLLREAVGGPAHDADEAGVASFHGLKPGDYRVIAFEDIPPGAWQDPDFLKPYEARAVDVKLEPSGTQAVQLKAVPAAETDQ